MLFLSQVGDGWAHLCFETLPLLRRHKKAQPPTGPFPPLVLCLNALLLKFFQQKPTPGFPRQRRQYPRRSNSPAAQLPAFPRRQQLSPACQELWNLGDDPVCIGKFVFVFVSNGFWPVFCASCPQRALGRSPADEILLTTARSHTRRNAKAPSLCSPALVAAPLADESACHPGKKKEKKGGGAVYQHLLWRGC